MRPTRSLRARLTALFTLAGTALLLLVSLGILAHSLSTADRAAVRALDVSEARVRAEVTEEAEWTPAELVREENEVLERFDGAIVVLDAAGRPLARSPGRVPAWPRRGNDGWRVRTIPTRNGTVMVGLPWFRTEAALRAQAGLLFGMVGCMALVTAAGTWLLVGRTLQPIRSLARQAGAASGTETSPRLEAPSADAEVVELVDTLNRLLERVTQTTAARGRFYAAASHELRTPLQALAGHLELALSRPRSQEEYRAVVEEANSQARRFTRLVQELLLLNQLHQRTSRPPSEPVDLSELLERILLQLAPAWRARGLAVRQSIPPEALADLPIVHAEVVLRNLTENAAKYAVPETAVSVELRREGAGWMFEVYNRCTDGLQVRADQVFEPFFRPDASRNSQTGGNGLGLAICKAVADVNGWELEWACEEQGVRARVRFPAAPGAREDLRCGAASAASR